MRRVLLLLLRRELLIVSSFVEKSVIPAVRKDHWTTADEQVSWRLADARLERRERAKCAAADRTGERRDR